jgi:dolichyl-phosphate-mannose-protein mannosyltransferase
VIIEFVMSDIMVMLRRRTWFRHYDSACEHAGWLSTFSSSPVPWRQQTYETLFSSSPSVHPISPDCSSEQQVTLYPHRDVNNEWRIINATSEGDPEFDWTTSPLEYIKPGMKVKLFHIATDRHLHSHDVRPPVSDVDFQNEVSAYGMRGFAGDANDFWVFELAEGDSKDSEARHRLRAIRTRFRLRHYLTGCYLFSHKVKLPDWGYEQQEVTCNKNAKRANSLWYVETSTHEKRMWSFLLGHNWRLFAETRRLLAKVPKDAPTVNYDKPGFLSKFFELQRVMWNTNAGLTDRHIFDSRPFSWPRLRRGIVSIISFSCR